MSKDKEPASKLNLDAGFIKSCLVERIDASWSLAYTGGGAEGGADGSEDGDEDVDDPLVLVAVVGLR